MRFAFRPPNAQTIRPHLIEDEDASDDGVVLVDEAFAGALAESHSPGERMLVLALSNRDAPAQPTPRPLIVAARISRDVSGLAVPRSLHTAHPATFTVSRAARNDPNLQTHSAVAVQPISLSSIFIAAPSSAAHASHTFDRLQDMLCQRTRVIRQGETVSISISEEAVDSGASHSNGMANGHAPPRDWQFQVLACEPVTQGFASRGSTQIHVTYLDDDSDDSDDVDHRLEAESPSDDEFEIDEHFLAASLGAPLMRRPPYSYSQSESSISTSDLSSVTGEDEDGVEEIKVKPQRLTEANVEKLGPLTAPVHGGRATDDRTIYVLPQVLGRAGVFAGDWVVIRQHISSRTSEAGSVDSRLARLQVLDNSADATTCLCAPALQANIAGDALFASFASDPIASAGSYSPPETSIAIRPTSFGAADPPIPTARGLTIARVPSGASTDRTLQPLCLRALKSYFASGKRLVRKGDLLAVSIDRSQASLIATEDKADEDTEVLSVSAGASAPTDVVFFKITNLEYDVVDRRSSEQTDIEDSYVAATMGELGVWVDADVTKMMQSGVERARVPDCTTYLGLEPPPRDRNSTSNPNFEKLQGILGACLRPNAWEFAMHMSALVRGPRGSGKSTVVRRAAAALGLNVYEVNCYDILGESEAATEGILRARFARATECAPCLFLLRQVQALARTSQTLEAGRDPLVVSALRSCLEELRQSWQSAEAPVFVVGTTAEHDRMPPALLSCFKHEIVVDTPAEPERLQILQAIVHQSGKPLALDVSLEELATQTAALVAADLVDLVRRAGLAAVSRALKATAGSGATEFDITAAGLPLTSADFDEALSKARAAYSTSIGAPRIPNVTWDDVGGLANVKSEILDTIQLPLEHPELFAGGLKKRSGILLYGPPGTGKTLLAKAVATSCALNFFSVKGPELLNMYIGESEANVRRVFARARAARPCVVFFDELDSVAPRRGVQGDSGGVMDRIVSQMLAELDGVAEGDGVGDVFVIGATNRPDLLDPALLRPGRFDRMLYLGISDTHDAQLRILQALTRKFKLHPDLDLAAIAERCPFNYTGADFYALCSDSMLKAMSRKAQEIDDRIAAINASPDAGSGPHPHPMTPQYYLAELAKPEEIAVLVSQVDFEAALAELVPSVSQAELSHYASVQARFANETINSTSKKGKGKAKAE